MDTASSTELQEVPGIGPVTVDKILKMRKSYGPFKSVDDLRAIKGLEKMRKYLAVRGPSLKKPSQSSTNKTKTQPPPADNSSEDPEPKPE